MEDYISLILVTPTRLFPRFKCKSIKFASDSGEMNILPSFTDFLANVEICELTVVTTEGKELFFALGGGAVTVIDNTVKMMVEACEFLDEIVPERIQVEKALAEERIKTATTFSEKRRGELKLKRSLNREEILKRHGIKFN